MAERPGRAPGDPPPYSPGAQAQAGDAGGSDDAVDQLLDDPGTERGPGLWSAPSRAGPRASEPTVTGQAAPVRTLAAGPSPLGVGPTRNKPATRRELGPRSRRQHHPARPLLGHQDPDVSGQVSAIAWERGSGTGTGRASPEGRGTAWTRALAQGPPRGPQDPRKGTRPVRRVGMGQAARLPGAPPQAAPSCPHPSSVGTPSCRPVARRAVRRARGCRAPYRCRECCSLSRRLSGSLPSSACTPGGNVGISKLSSKMPKANCP